eukprot:scaffold85992_cov63-Phaeocystis_antarctica.AAC.12
MSDMCIIRCFAGVRGAAVKTPKPPCKFPGQVLHVAFSADRVYRDMHRDVHRASPWASLRHSGKLWRGSHPVGREGDVDREAHAGQTGREGPQQRRDEGEGQQVVGEEGAELRLHHGQEVVVEQAAHLLEARALEQRREHEEERVLDGRPDARVERRLHEDEEIVCGADAVQLSELLGRDRRQYASDPLRHVRDGDVALQPA